MSEHVVIVGAGSGIARALAHVLAARGCRLVLAGRQLDELERNAADLRCRYQAQVAVEAFDALDANSHGGFVDRCLTQLDQRLDGVVICCGVLPDQHAAESDAEVLRTSIEVNFTSTAVLLEQFARRLEQQAQGGYLAAISSVAGDRGRQSNYVYGSAKAGLSAYLQGLRNRLAKREIHVLTIKPGFVRTAMTRGLLKPGSRIVAAPERVAADIDRAIRRRCDVIYTPWFWRYIMLIIRSIPEWLFKRLSL